jgi:hypothetical protein
MSLASRWRALLSSQRAKTRVSATAALHRSAGKAGSGGLGSKRAVLARTGLPPLGCPATGDDVHELQPIPQQLPDEEDAADVASPGDLQSKHGSFSFSQNGTGFFTNGRKLLEFEPALIHFMNSRGFCGAQE